ncbi:MAG: alpha-hydroxy-acid oxidizing protein [Legionella sp.]|nr:alpha-hydroxy-acid oxidizing protein [Legionella sp.]
MNAPITLIEYRTLAKDKLPQKIFDFIDGGAGDEITKHNNSAAFDDINLRPLCLRDVSSVDLSIKLLGYSASCPFIIAPTAFHKLVDGKGELSTALAAKQSGIPMVVSSMSNISLEKIAEGSMSDNLWLQVYIFKDRAITRELILRAEKAGYKAILVTIGVAVMGKRNKDIRNHFTLAPELSTGNFQSTANNVPIFEFSAQALDPSVTWEDIEWLKTFTKLPIILKGIMNSLDAEKACQLNIAGIVVSNHGGRQLDTTEATIKVLPEIAHVVANRTTLMLDSGVRRGTDVFKAIALGADAIFLGRPILWALSVGGEQGVVHVLKLLKNEFEMAMKLLGCRSVQEIRQLGKHILVL